jgi:hypothetical protein
MFRTALLRSARSSSSQAVRNSSAIARSATQSSLITKSRFAPSAFQAARCYSAAAGLQKPEVEGRIVDLLKNFDKVGYGLRSDRASADIFPRFPIHRRYDSTEMIAYPLHLALTANSCHLHLTSRTILVWIAWILLRL